MRELGLARKLSRRTLLISVAGSTSMLAGTLRWAEAGTKASQSAVHYQNTPQNGQDCAHCYQFMAPNSCKLVDGDVNPTGWCRLWVKKPG
jgi:hypothetical protein